MQERDKIDALFSVKAIADATAEGFNGDEAHDQEKALEALLDITKVLRLAMPRRSVMTMLRDRGLPMQRFATADAVKLVGVRTTGEGRHLWEIEVRKELKTATILEDGQPLMFIRAAKKPNILEKVAVRDMAFIIMERLRRRVLRKQAKHSAGGAE